MSNNPVLTAIEHQRWLQPIQDKGKVILENAFKAAGPAEQTIKDALHGTWLGHPLHPAITDVPTGSWTVALALDLLEVRGETNFRAGADAAVLIGLLGSVPAAVTGLSEWNNTHGKAQRVGALHGLLNTSAAICYAASYAARRSNQRGWGRRLGFFGYALLVAGAYLGGELTYTYRVGVKP